MSRNTSHNLRCPHCGHKQETKVWDSLNVTLDPDLKKKLYSAEINLFDCVECKKKSFINAPLLYHDMKQQFCVQYYPQESLDDAQFFRQFNTDGSISIPGIPDAFAKSGEYLTRPHIVFDMNEMIRYVVFRDHVANRSDK